MRTIYAIQLQPRLRTAQPASTGFDDLLERICRWVQTKYDRAWHTSVTVSRDGTEVTPLTGHSIKGRRQAAENSELFTLDWLHPADGDASSTWAITAVLARKGDDLQFALMLRITTTRVVLRPVRYDLGRPRIVSELLEAYPATIDD